MGVLQKQDKANRSAVGAKTKKENPHDTALGSKDKYIQKGVMY